MEVALLAIARLLAAIPEWKPRRATQMQREWCAVLHHILTRGTAA